MNKLSQMLVIDLLMLVLGISISAVILMQGNVSFDSEYRRYEMFYTQSSLTSMLNYNPDIPLIRRLSIYLCEPDNEMLETLENQTKYVLDNFNRHGYNYILLVNHTNGFRVYNNISDVCLEKINLARFNLTLTCGSAELIFGTWKDGDDVIC